jgi:GNAT superfamily N-acetyltransferase
MSITIRPAVIDDAPAILALVRELAEYERLPHMVEATEASLEESLFGERPGAEALIAESDEGPVGFAVFFFNYSTFLGRSGIYLEDLYVRPEMRGQGIGKQLLAEVARRAVERGCQRLEWAVLDWNEPSIQFYKSLGAKPLDDWTTYRMTPEAIAKLANS